MKSRMIMDDNLPGNHRKKAVKRVGGMGNENYQDDLENREWSKHASSKFLMQRHHIVWCNQIVAIVTHEGPRFFTLSQPWGTYYLLDCVHFVSSSSYVSVINFNPAFKICSLDLYYCVVQIVSLSICGVSNVCICMCSPSSTQKSGCHLARQNSPVHNVHWVTVPC